MILSSFKVIKNILSRLDINRAYHNIMVASENVGKTAFTTPFGLYEVHAYDVWVEECGSNVPVFHQIFFLACAR